MKDQILKIAKVKSEKEFYKKYPSEAAFMKAHSKEFKKAAMGASMVNRQLDQLTDFGNTPIAQDGSWLTGIPGLSTAKFDKSTGLVNNASGSVSKADTTALGFEKNAPGSAGAFNAGAAGMAGLQGIGQVLGGIEAIGAQKKAQKKAQQNTQLSSLALQASQPGQQDARRYTRPEDSLIQPGQLGSPQGTGTNYLAQYGANIGDNPTEVQNTYNPGDLYNDLGFTPLNNNNPKQYRHGGNLPQAEFGEYFQDSGQAQIGSAVGGAIATGFGLPPELGQLAGKFIGNISGGVKDARKLQEEKDKSAFSNAQGAFQQNNQFGSFMEDGGYMNPQYNPQVITKFGDYNIDDLLQPPSNVDMLRAGGHLKEYTPPSAEAMYTGRQEMQYGGQLAMGGDLQVDGGKAESISYNPFLPNGGETVMFKGPSHANGGIDVQYGQNGVEVEGGEPAVKLQDGGSDGSLVVFGNMKLSKTSADEFGIPDANGKKFKHVANEISKVENKQNKIAKSAGERANMIDENDRYDQLGMNTSQAQLIGTKMKLRSAAILKQNLASVQNAILDTASELGVKSDELAQGKLVKETDKRMIAQDGTNIESFLKTPYNERKKLANDLGYTKYNGKDISQQNKLYDLFKNNSNKSLVPGDGVRQLKPFNVNDLVPQFGSKQDDVTIPYQQGYSEPSMLPEVTVTSHRNKLDPTIDDTTTDTNTGGKFMNALKATGKFLGKGYDKYGETLLSNIAPFLRPSNQQDLDPSQLYPEYYALANNQLEGVKAQTFQPMLDTPYDISLNDQVNAIDSQSRAAIRAAGQNPAAQSMIMAQSLEAKNKVLGEQSRINQANKMQVYGKNRDMLNQSQLQNLQILDQQYTRQAQAKSNTKAQTMSALSSIAAKTAQNKLENRKLAINENLYGYRFTPSGRAINANNPYQFNMQGNPFNRTNTASGQLESGYEDLFNASGHRVDTRKIGTTKNTFKDGGNIKARNGSIVKALKSL